MPRRAGPAVPGKPPKKTAPARSTEAAKIVKLSADTDNIAIRSKGCKRRGSIMEHVAMTADIVSLDGYHARQLAQEDESPGEPILLRIVVQAQLQARLAAKLDQLADEAAAIGLLSLAAQMSISAGELREGVAA